MNILELFPQSGPSDWKMYLEKTLVLTCFPKETQHELCLVNTILDDLENPQIELARLSKRTSCMITPKTWDVLLPQPDFGFYSVRRTAIFLSRLAMRQNKKGICAQTISQINLFKPVLDVFCNLQRSTGISGSLQKSLIESVSIPNTCESFYEILTVPIRFFELEEACKRITQNKVFARALSKHFAVSAAFKTKYPYVLWYNNLPVADITDDCKIIVNEHLFFQETFDVFNQKYEVTAT